MKILSKRGAALLQVLLIAIVLAGMAAMLLRASLSRTVSSRKTRRAVTAEMLIENCMAEVNAIWNLKDDTRFVDELYDGNVMYRSEDGTIASSYTCYSGGGKYRVDVVLGRDNANQPIMTYTVDGLD